MQRVVRPDQTRGERPALTALVIYARPAPREPLLSTFAELGIFVVEHQGLDGAIDALLDAVPDIVCLAIGSKAEHLVLAEVIARCPFSPTIALLPDEAARRRLDRTGVEATLTDAAVARGASPRLAAIARRARTMQRKNDAAKAPLFFRSLRAVEDGTRLANDERAVALTRAERRVLARLFLATDRALSRGELERSVLRVSAAPSAVTTAVRGLRRKAAALGGDASCLRTVRGFGFVLME